MKGNIESVIGFAISATDGEIGKVSDFYFDDESWTIRYFVVETGSWLFSRKVLIAPQAIEKTDLDGNAFISNLTRQQVKESPDIDTDKPVSRQQEMELYKYYPWAGYSAGGLWAGGMGATGIVMSPPADNITLKESDTTSEQSDTDPHLRSTQKVIGYKVKAKDGDIGEIERFIVDDNTWTIKFLIVDTGNWFPGKKTIISPQWIMDIDWASSEVVVNASVEQVKNSPEYQSGNTMPEDYERVLTNYYGRFITHDKLEG